MAFSSPRGLHLVADELDVTAALARDGFRTAWTITREIVGALGRRPHQSKPRWVARLLVVLAAAIVAAPFVMVFASCSALLAFFAVGLACVAAYSAVMGAAEISPVLLAVSGGAAVAWLVMPEGAMRTRVGNVAIGVLVLGLVYIVGVNWPDTIGPDEV